MGLVNENEQKSLFRRDSDSPQAKATSFMMEQQGGSFSPSFRDNNTLLQSFKIVILSNKLNLLLPFGPLGILLHYYLTDNKVSYKFRYVPRFDSCCCDSGMGFPIELSRNYTIGWTSRICHRVSKPSLQLPYYHYFFFFSKYLPVYLCIRQLAYYTGPTGMTSFLFFRITFPPSLPPDIVFQTNFHSWRSP